MLATGKLPEHPFITGVLDSLPDPVMLLDTEFCVIHMNKSMKALLKKARPDDDFITKCCLAVHGTEAPAKHCPLAKTKLSRRKEVASVQYRDKFYSVTVDPIFDGADKLIGAVHVMSDITARKNILELSRRDKLTKLYNRSHFEVELNRVPSGTPCGIVSCDIDGLKMVNDSFGFKQADSMIVAVGKVLKKCIGEQHLLARTGSGSFAAILRDVSQSELDIACKTIRKNIDRHNGNNPERPPISLSVGYGYTAALAGSPGDLLLEADKYMHRRKLLGTKSTRGAIPNIVKTLLEARDFNTKYHSERTLELAARFADELSLPEPSVDNLKLLARFHDIGKIGIRDGILLKPGPLDPTERTEMNKHSEIGYHLAVSIPEIGHIADLILKHHEWWNGKGYPLNLKGDEIPLECRALAIVDAYDAMVSDRPYRAAMSHDYAMAEIRRCSGTQFDPGLANLFIKLF